MRSYIQTKWCLSSQTKIIKRGMNAKKIKPYATVITPLETLFTKVKQNYQKLEYQMIVNHTYCRSVSCHFFLPSVLYMVSIMNKATSRKMKKVKVIHKFRLCFLSSSSILTSLIILIFSSLDSSAASKLTLSGPATI